MPQAFFVTSGFFTAGGAGNAPATSSPGDTFQVPSFNVNSPAYLENMWVQGASTDWISVKSPKMHDNNQGIRLRTGGTQQRFLLQQGMEQPLYPVDTPTVTIDETAAASGAITLMYRFTDLPGIQPRLDTWTNIQPRIKQISGVDVALGACPAIGSYSAGNAINSTFDNFQAGVDYALIGYLASSAGLTLAVQGIDTGNVKVGGPLSVDPLVTAGFFADLSTDSGFPTIPIIAANNKGSTNVYQVANSALAAQTVTLILAMLG
jgi:hypothetical protein